MAWLDVLRSTPGLSEDDVKRYGSKLLLVLIEAYMLDCIGKLATGDLYQLQPGPGGPR